ncbi:MAG: DUF1573 domain-containing protein [Microscillaceae bacterium]|nr:DUF1573 domain-containing protein [Microscillaceae bacterium]
MMKRALLLTGFMVMTLSMVMAQNLRPATPTTKQSTMLWNKTEHDFQNIPQGVPVSTTFKVTNKSGKPLIIKEVKPSCGCTTPTYTTDPIRPGEAGEIKAQYNAAALGVFNKSITSLPMTPTTQPYCSISKEK